MDGVLLAEEEIANELDISHGSNFVLDVFSVYSRNNTKPDNVLKKSSNKPFVWIISNKGFNMVYIGLILKYEVPAEFLGLMIIPLLAPLHGYCLHILRCHLIETCYIKRIVDR
ncbi:hypothetical protein AVEN_270879-1 [Araneus ventricosus]|uniref:Uncharacterized protein n=1 Tax=Araneus ventricosus TaxID=182803 RepID=A0A4Y2LZ76_ARAVE|nr:hypothetical protein AVEN_270879-1 [Araneus ventricosus]